MLPEHYSLLMSLCIGMLECSRRRHSRAALFFALSTAFRSNGVMNAGFLLWDLGARDVVMNWKLVRHSADCLYFQY